MNWMFFGFWSPWKDVEKLGSGSVNYIPEMNPIVYWRMDGESAAAFRIWMIDHGGLEKFCNAITTPQRKRKLHIWSYCITTDQLEIKRDSIMMKTTLHSGKLTSWKCSGWKTDHQRTARPSSLLRIKTREGVVGRTNKDEDREREYVCVCVISPSERANEPEKQIIRIRCWGSQERNFFCYKWLA